MNVLLALLRGGCFWVFHIRLLLHNGGNILMWLVLKPCWSHVVETVESVVNISWHGQVDFSLDIIPFYGETAILFAVPIHHHLIMFLNYF